MAAPTSRREALKRLALGAAVFSGAAGAAAGRFDRGTAGVRTVRGERQVRSYEVPPRPGAPVMAIAKSSHEPAVLTRRAVEALGGMQRFVARGDVVVVKPNIGWDRLPVHAANTNPLVVAELVRMALEAGAKRVVVTDVSCNDPTRCFQRSGIWQAAHAAGGSVVLPSAQRFRDIRIRGDLLDEWPVFAPLVDADKVINAPVAKHHNLCRYSGAMKNWYGLLGGRRHRLHQNIDLSIADLAAFLRPSLTVLDATRVLVRNGPQGGNVDDARDVGQVVASLDQVAVDAYGATLIGERWENIGYLGVGEQHGLGSRDPSRVARLEV